MSLDFPESFFKTSYALIKKPQFFPENQSLNKNLYVNSQKDEKNFMVNFRQLLTEIDIWT